MKALVATVSSQCLIVTGITGIAMRAAGHLREEPRWLSELLGYGTFFVVFIGLHLFGLALKWEILEAVRKRRRVDGRASSPPSPGDG